MSLLRMIASLLGLDETLSVERVRFTLGAPWAHESPAWIVFGCVALVVLGFVFYFRYQPDRSRWIRAGLAGARAVVLGLLLVALAEPALTLLVTTRPRPSLWVLFDGTDSMGIADELSETEGQRLAAAVGLTARSAGGPPARIDYVRAMVGREERNLFARLEEKYRLRPFLFDRAAGVRLLEPSRQGQPKLDAKYLASQITARGQVTALGAAINELGRQYASSSLAGLVVVSDFNQNSGPPALEAARQLGVKVYTIGVGPQAAADVSVNLQAPLVTKKDERATLIVTLHQQGLAGTVVPLKVTARPIAAGGQDRGAPVVVGEKTIRLGDAVQTIDFPYQPDKTGRFEVTAEVSPVAGEVVQENNRAQREVSVRDDFIRLMFVEYEPTWEWRFIKEVFHRDKLVGMRGFRTFLRSADPKVRQTNPLFLTTMNPPRSEFFTHDVIVLGDLPAAALSGPFCQMTEEFVSNFGGGLVVTAGPRFGPSQMVETPLAKMLPVVLDPAGRIRDREPFALRLRPEASQVDFMQLGSETGESTKGWDNLGLLPWYQPVERLHPMAAALAEHPTDKTADGKTHQPLVAMRRYGRGEVIWLGFNETWRLRRKFGERYYRQFWGQMIHRLALSHALGTQKRFVVRTDRRRYLAEDQVLVTVEAYDNDFQPLAESQVPNRSLRGELLLPEQARRDGREAQPLPVPALRPGVFETRFPVFAAGEHRVRVIDPLTEQPVEVAFQVASASVERQRAVRNVALEQALADATGGKCYDLATADRLPDEIRLQARGETHEMTIALWNTWLFFLVAVILMLGEWLLRKWVNLP
jgi:hypothetical protein